MPIFDAYWKRQKRLRGEMPDVYQYTDIPQEFRVQVVHILTDALGEAVEFNRPTVTIYKTVHATLTRELGVFRLSEETPSSRYDHAVLDFLLNQRDTEIVMGVIELLFQTVDTKARDYSFTAYMQPAMSPDDAINELNGRFLEKGIGYRFESGQLIRIDSDWLHNEAVKPALAILREKSFAGANDEFLRAHDHYRHGRHKECLNECLKCLESVLKVICDKRGWIYKKDQATANDLLKLCFDKGLIPSYLQTQFGALKSTLESGVPTVRNKRGGHGQGTEVVAVPQYLANYLLNLTATSVLFLVEASKQ